MGFLGRTWVLTQKNLIIVAQRAWLTTLIRAFIAPIIFFFFLGYSKTFFVPPARFGVGSPAPLPSFTDALNQATNRDTVAFVRNGFTGGEIEDVINELAETIQSNGQKVEIIDEEIELLSVCRSSLRGASNCYAAASFTSSPTEGEGGNWNYTLRTDSSFSASVFVERNNNPPQIYILPFQHAIDEAIIRRVSEQDGDVTELPNRIDEYTYTYRTQEQRERAIQSLFMDSLIDIFGLAFYIGMCGITYHLTGHMAAERELGISQLIDAMVPSRSTWHTQAARLLSTHIAFDIVYLPAWIIMGILAQVLVFVESSIAIGLFYHILLGLALTSFSLFGAALFRKAQLSGITMVLFTIILAIIAQVAGITQAGAVYVLSLLFAPMNYTFFINYQARFELLALPANLAKNPPPREDTPWQIPGYVFFIFLVIQIFAFPVAAALVERQLYGTADKRRELDVSAESSHAVELSSFSKHYVPSKWRQWSAKLFRTEKPETVFAVNDVSLTASRGHILALLGANGSGKSTSLNAITGLSTFTAGSIKVDGSGGLGYCPQKNVMWDDLTVLEHVKIFNKLKSSSGFDSKEQLESLISQVDLSHKLKAKSKTLSGGQKRKLQLAMMFTGGSKTCCIDEISSGLDPVSRRKIWDILMAERGARTMILTTHFLDEADVLADRIAILSKGHLKAEGSAAELKHRLGGGYRIYIDRHASIDLDGLSIADLRHRQVADKIIYQMPLSADAAQFVNHIERQGFHDYQVTGPSIEDVFLKLAEEIQESFGAANAQRAAEDAGALRSETKKDDDGTLSDPESTRDQVVQIDKDHLNMTSGKGLGMIPQAWILFRKRFTILQRNFFPYLAALLLPIIAAGLVTLFLVGFDGLTCDPSLLSTNPSIQSFASEVGSETGYNSTTQVAVGPSNRVNIDNLVALTGLNQGGFRVFESLDDFQAFIRQNQATVKPGGFFLGDIPTYAYEGDNRLWHPLLLQNMFDNAVSGANITTRYQALAIARSESVGDSLQFILYFGLAMCAFPGFLALYPASERLRKVRALHYSNGIRAAPIWFAYLAFDAIFVLLISAITIGIFVGANNIFYAPGYVFLGFFLYGIASTLIAYVVSLFATSQLAAFAVTAGMQCSFFLLYFIINMTITTFTDPTTIDNNLLIANFTWNAIATAGNLLQLLLLTLNQFQLLCTDDNTLESYPGSITAYGSIILYLTIHIILLMTFLIWWDSGSGFGFAWLRKKAPDAIDAENDPSVDTKDLSCIEEANRIDSMDLPLKVMHVSKQFGKNMLAVQDMSFGVDHSEVFALLGPNGAGKSTTISLIRGDLQPSYRGGDILVENTSISKQRAKARLHLGVCPQFDAMDTMTVTEHLKFYARVRGVPKDEVDRNVDIVIQAVGLTPYTRRMAAKLSGGNQRKLSLGIAMMGNPSVLLLDEPSSGMDAAAKRVMWRTLAAVSKGRALLITTHSMEEADALATRAGIMAQRMLAIGKTDELRERYGGGWYLHLVLFNASEASDAQMQSVAIWVKSKIPGATIQGKMMHGQIRVRVEGEKLGAGSLFDILESEGRDNGIEYYSIGRATLDQVFLEIIGPREDE